MESSSEEAEQATSFIIRSFLFSLALLACTKPAKEKPVLGSTKTLALTKPKDVQLQKPPLPKRKKKIYLTFDDGPNRGTRNVMKIASAEQVPITFFIIGEHASASRTQQITWDSLAAAPDSLVELCNHSYSHAWHNKFNSFYQSPDSVVKDFIRCRDSLQLKNNIVRTPGRNTWRIDTIQFTDLKKSAAAVDSLEKAGFIVMGWDLEWHYDVKLLGLKNKSDELLKQIDSIFKKGKTKSLEHLVLLAHDQVYADADDSCELHTFIKNLKLNSEYELELATKYPGVKQ